MTCRKLTPVDAQSVVERVTRVWNDDALPAITESTRIPNRSPALDPPWAEHGRTLVILAKVAATHLLDAHARR